MAPGFKFSTFRTNGPKDTEGIWVEYAPGFSLKIARFNNPDFITCLRKRRRPYLRSMRRGTIDDDVRMYLNRRVDADTGWDPEGSTHLFPKRDTAEKFNLERLAQIKMPLAEFPTEYSGRPEAVEQLMKQAPIPELLQIKESALVMMRVMICATAGPHIYTLASRITARVIPLPGNNSGLLTRPPVR